jgi:hypothetical protein
LESDDVMRLDARVLLKGPSGAERTKAIPREPAYGIVVARASVSR